MLEYKPVNLRARRLAIEAYKLQDLLHIKSIVVSLARNHTSDMPGDVVPRETEVVAA